MSESKDGFWRKVGSIVVDEIVQQGALGSAEISAALFQGSGFVMYNRRDHDNNQQQSPEVEAPKTPTTPTTEKERDEGMER